MQVLAYARSVKVTVRFLKFDVVTLFDPQNIPAFLRLRHLTQQPFDRDKPPFFAKESLHISTSTSFVRLQSSSPQSSTYRPYPQYTTSSPFDLYQIINMSAAASPAASESENKRGEVTYRFCPEW
jgi:hypothetical protein